MAIEGTNTLPEVIIKLKNEIHIYGYIQNLKVFLAGVTAAKKTKKKNCWF